MILYSPLWETMRSKGVTQYVLIHKYHVSPGQLTRMKRNESVSTHTIEMFCRILDCPVQAVMLYQPSPFSTETPETAFSDESSFDPSLNKAAEPGVSYHS
ncbi:MAG: helix-turn-helix transcriptional regulator [Clostridia bacterium]|nr:helix-turn-helix transcriptional regulator [Clostridia bacterium]